MTTNAVNAVQDKVAIMTDAARERALRPPSLPQTPPHQPSGRPRGLNAPA
jgi:hypothetical protein